MRTKSGACDVCKVRKREKVSHRFCFPPAAHLCLTSSRANFHFNITNIII